MKVFLFNISLFLFSLILFIACNSGDTNQTERKNDGPTGTNQEVAGVTYTCPMHPEVTSHEPGKCPQCGMKLEKAAAAEHEHQPGDQH